MKTRILVLALASVFVLPAFAAAAKPDDKTAKPIVPAITASVPTSADQWNDLTKAPPQAKLSFKTKRQAEQSIVAAYNAGKISSMPPIASDDGTVLYPYGQSWPTVVCSPLHICVVQLGAGDKPSQVVLGQPGMWSLTQAMAGDTPVLALAPRFKDLHTNLMVTATAKDGSPRIYYVNLVSDNSKYVPKVGFYFPDSINQAWVAQAQGVQAVQQKTELAAQKADQQTVAALPGLTASKLDFNWTVSCGSHTNSWFSSAPDCSSIKPERVFADGVHTYIKMPGNLANTSGLPTIMATNTAGQAAIINYRFKDGYFVVDGVPTQINLVAGNGDGSKQRLVTIKHGE